MMLTIAGTYTFAVSLQTIIALYGQLMPTIQGYVLSLICAYRIYGKTFNC
jgi:hypothetical protein